MDNVLKKINVDGTLYSIHESKVAESGGTAESLVTTGEKYTWNNKSSFSGSYNDLTDKPTIPTVPTNVSSFTNDAGYLTQHQDISGKANIADISVSVTSTLLGFDANGHDYVEIGGIKWATMNVGANSITDTGLYFQWGDTQGYTADQVGSGESQKYFGWADYKYGNGTSSPGATGMTKYNATDGKTVLEASDDAAVANWGGSWRMPTTAEFQALGNAVNTAWTADYQGSGVAGLVCTDKTDSSKTLFFPAAGYCDYGSVGGVGNSGDYWSSSLYTDDRQSAYDLYFDSDDAYWGSGNNRYYGFPVRGVLAEEQITTTTSVLGTTVLPSEKELWNSKANQSDLVALQDSITPYYGIKWTDSNTTPVRTGNMELHKTLPIQSLMRRCMVTDSGEVRYIDQSDYTKYINGDTVDYTGAHGLFMVEIPEYPYEVINNGSEHELRLYINDTLTSKKSKKVYISAVEATSDDASGATTPKLYSIITTNIPSSGTISATSLTYTTNATSYRGGNLRTTSSWDSAANSQLGRPVTNLTRAAFRTRAAARGTGWSQQYWDAYNAFVRLYIVEYCSFNTLATYNSSNTSDGYKQGGLGPGVSILDGTHWSNFNGYNPIVPCGVTLRLGNSTGVVSYSVTATSSYTLYVPSYRGIENPFGHIWKWTDGMNILGNTPTGKSTIYTCSDITKFADNTSDNYILKTLNAPYGTEGYIKTMNIDENGDFIPTAQGGSSDSYYYDYSWFQNTGWKVLVSGGHAVYGAHCGLFCFDADTDSGRAHAAVGGRLYYTPSK